MVFGDVNLRDAQIRGHHNPGQGGWPTVRYFNKETGYEGASYQKKTNKAMCDELGDLTYMQALVEEAGKTSVHSCKLDGEGCDEKEQKFITKWSAKEAEAVTKQVARLENMKAKGKMAPHLLKWVNKRLNILNQLSATGEAPSHDEL